MIARSLLIAEYDSRVTREDGGFGAECGDPSVPQQGVP
jgi:hypothetical protein